MIPVHFRRDGRGYDVIDTPDTFMNALSGDIIRYEADGNNVKVVDRHAYAQVDGDTVGIDLDGAGRAAVLLHFV